MNGGMRKKKLVLRLLKSDKGYLHREVEESSWHEEGELNHRFTDNPLDAHEFPEYRKGQYVPKYLGVPFDAELKNEADCCAFLNGRIVNVEVEIVTTWKELD